MRAYSIFDDYPAEAVRNLREAGIDISVHPGGVPRPDDEQMMEILKTYDCVVIGTSQKIRADMLECIDGERLIVTASAGTDHIEIPEDKRGSVTILNTPGANTVSVAEYIIGSMLVARKRIFEGAGLYSRGCNNKKLIRKPEDIYGSRVGLVGAGRIAGKVMEMLAPFEVGIMCHTRDPEKHTDLAERFGAEFVPLERLADRADIIAVCVPLTDTTRGLISAGIIERMRDDCIFISISREDVVDIDALLGKAEANENFYAVLDIDVSDRYSGRCNCRNIMITPHIAGGTIGSRKRMFMETAEKMIRYERSKAGGG